MRPGAARVACTRSGPPDAEPLRVHATRAAPGRIEGRLHAHGHPVQDERRERGRIDHRGMLEPHPDLAQLRQAHDVRRCPESEHDLIHGSIADDMEGRYGAYPGDRDPVSGDLLGIEVQVAVIGSDAAPKVAVRLAEGRGAGTEGAVDIEVATTGREYRDSSQQ